MNINVKIKEVKERLTQLTKNFPYTEEQINIFTICYITMASIDNDITDLLDEVFSRVFILFNNGNFDKLLTKLGASIDNGGFHKTPDFDLNCKDNYEYINININKTKIFGMICLPVLFEYIIHEIKHSINAVVKSFETDGKESYSNNGIYFYKYDGSTYYEANIMLDEAFNSFITKIYLATIKDLSQMSIDDEGISTILREYNLDDNYLYAYLCTEIWEPLFKDQTIFTTFYNAALYHDYLPLNELLAKIFNQDMEGKAIPFDDLLDYLNELSENYENGSHKNIENYLKKISKEYPKRKLKIKPYFDNI